MGTPSEPNISTSALCQRTSESRRSPSISNKVARKVTAQPLHNPKDGEFMIVRALEPGDLEAVATRVGDQLTRDARRNSLVNPDFRPTVYKAALVRAPDQTWVAEENGQIVGHLFGALLDSAEYGLS